MSLRVRGACLQLVGLHAVPYLWGTTGLGINLDQVRQRLGKDAPLASLMLLVVGLFALAAWWRAGRFRQRQ